MGDHSRFIFESLAPKEQAEIKQADYFIHSFDRLLEMEIQLFQAFLYDLEELRLEDEILGTFSPLMADHMSREECYYLMKLSKVSDVKSPDCYPTRPRIE